MRKFLIVDDHPLFREVLVATLRSLFSDADVLDTSTLGDAVSLLERDRHRFDLLLLDLSLPSVSGFEGLLMLRSRFPTLPIIIVSSFDSPRVIHGALVHKANGFVSKSAGKEELSSAITKVLAGGTYVFPNDSSDVGADLDDEKNDAVAARLAVLTPRQLRVLEKIRQGKLNKQIAYELGIGEQTVKAHVSEILHKLNVVSRTQLVIETTSIDIDNILYDQR